MSSIYQVGSPRQNQKDSIDQSQASTSLDAPDGSLPVCTAEPYWTPDSLC